MLYTLSKSIFSGYTDAQNGISKFERFWLDYGILIVFLVIVAAFVVGLVLWFIPDAPPKKPKCVYLRDGEKLTELECGTSKPLLLPYPKREGYAFGGWFYDSACTVPYVSTKRLKPNTVLYAKWLKEG